MSTAAADPAASAVSTHDFKAAIRELLRAIESQQGFTMQQSAKKGKLYFMWDFITNTLRMVGGPPEQQADAVQRSVFTEVLVTDTTGKLTVMVGGDSTEFDADVKARAADVAKLAGHWGKAHGLSG